MTKEELLANPKAKQMLEKYAEWLMEKDEEYGGNTWEVEDFFTWEGADGKRHSHGETSIVSDVRVTSFSQVVVMSCGYGDEGGPATLIGIFWGVDEKRLHHIIQEFDSALQIVFQTEY